MTKPQQNKEQAILKAAEREFLTKEMMMRMVVV